MGFLASQVYINQFPIGLRVDTYSYIAVIEFIAMLKEHVLSGTAFDLHHSALSSKRRTANRTLKELEQKMLKEKPSKIKNRG